MILYWSVSSWELLDHLKSFITTASCGKLCCKEKVPLPDKLLLTLMRLRLNLRGEDLCYRFHVSETSVSEIFHRIIAVMHSCLKFLIKWPTREVCQSNLPKIFRSLFPKHVSSIARRYL